MDIYIYFWQENDLIAKKCPSHCDIAMQLHGAMMVTRNFYQVERPQLSYLEGRSYRRRAVLVLNCKGLSTSECFRGICRIRTKYRSLGQCVCLEVILVFGHDFVLPKQQSDDLCVAYTSFLLDDKDFLYKNFF